jgi:kynurenine formamidase
MLIWFESSGKQFTADLSRPLDISIPLRNRSGNPSAFFLPAPEFMPFRYGDFVGATSEGGVCNCFTLSVSPHGNGTHTECVGHIAKEQYSITSCLAPTLFRAVVISVPVSEWNGDRIITLDNVRQQLGEHSPDALILRTLPNFPSKKRCQWSGSNPPYLEAAVGTFLAERGIEHLVLDVPSVDREEDGGDLAAHHAFWQYPENPRISATITEMAYIADEIPDGEFLLNIGIMPVESDASPSKPVLYRVWEV